MINTILPTPKKTEAFEGVSVVKAAIWTEHAPFAEYLAVFTDAVKRIFGIDAALRSAACGIWMLITSGIRSRCAALPG